MCPLSLGTSKQCLEHNPLFQVIFWKEFGFPAPFDRIMDFMHGKVGAGEAIIRVVTLLLTGKLKSCFVMCSRVNERYSNIHFQGSSHSASSVFSGPWRFRHTTLVATIP